MKSYRIGYIRSGHSDYENKVLNLLSKRHRYQKYFTEFDHLDLADCFILAGADIRTRIDGDDIQVEIFIDSEGKPDFMTRLGALISEKYASLGGSSTGCTQ